MSKIVLLSILLVVPALAFAGDIPVVDPLAAALALIGTWSTLTPLATASAIIVIIVAGLTKFVPTWKYKRLAVSVLSTVYGVVMASIGGMGIMEALVLTVITGGGAVSIYESIKGLLKLAGK